MSKKYALIHINKNIYLLVLTSSSAKPTYQTQFC